MKKLMILFLCLIAIASANSYGQELIANIGGGMSNAQGLKTNYGFCEARFMLGKNHTRFGPYFGVIGVYSNDTNQFGNAPTYYYKGRIFKYGLSIDRFGQFSNQYDYYFWLNSSLGFSQDQGATTPGYRSTQSDELCHISSGFRLNDPFNIAWPAHSLLMAEYQKPTKNGEIKAYWQGDSTAATPFNKESFRATLEIALKQFPIYWDMHENYFAPIAIIGFNSITGSERQYFEYGAGLSFGGYDQWYREWFKIKVYNRHDLGSPDYRKNALQIEVVINLLNWKM